MLEFARMAAPHAARLLRKSGVPFEWTDLFQECLAVHIADRSLLPCQVAGRVVASVRRQHRSHATDRAVVSARWAEKAVPGWVRLSLMECAARFAAEYAEGSFISGGWRVRLADLAFLIAESGIRPERVLDHWQSILDSFPDVPQSLVVALVRVVFGMPKDRAGTSLFAAYMLGRPLDPSVIGELFAGVTMALPDDALLGGVPA